MIYKATALIRTKIEANAAVKEKVDVTVNFKTLTSACPQYDLIDGGTPGWNYQPIGSFNLISGGNP